jgi:hypothetical protein
MRKIFSKRVVISIVIFVVLYIEILSYGLNTRHWLPLGGDDAVDGSFVSEETLRVLLVADPQIQGENNELAFFGLFTRWDADRLVLYDEVKNSKGIKILNFRKKTLDFMQSYVFYTGICKRTTS